MAPIEAEPADPVTTGPDITLTMPDTDRPAAESAGGFMMLNLIGDVTDESVTPLILAIGAQGVDGFILEINSGGGSVDAGFALVKAMENSMAPIHCIVDGEAQSMAFYILQSCTTRSMTKRSFLMIHNPSVYGRMGGNALTFQELAERLLALQNAMMEQYLAKMNITKKELQDKILTKNWYLGWEEASSTNAIDFALTSTHQVFLVAAAYQQAPE